MWQQTLRVFEKWVLRTEEEGCNGTMRELQDERAHDLYVLFTKC
jgi:hypothetical protein